jgi:trimeric autotransporter adhesin
MNTKYPILALIMVLNIEQAEGQVYIGSNTSMNISSGSLFVGGSVENNGNIIGSGKLLLKGSSSQSLSGTGSFTNMELDNAAGATVNAGSSLSITDTYTNTAGNLNVTSGLTLKSSAAGSARVAPIASGSITGNVTVERYVPAFGRRAWRLLGVPIESTGAPTIYNSWQEGGNATTGYGTHITQAGGAAVGGSFDAGQPTSGASSIRLYNNATNTLLTPSGTNVIISSQPAWFIYVRGDRAINIINNTSTSSNTTMRVTGQLKQGNQDFTVPAANYALIGNPYASSIDFAQAISNSSTTNTLTKYWVWDPKLNTSGGYVLFDAGLGYVPSVTGGSYSSATSIIQSGQGFFVKSNGSAGNLRIQEDDKASTWQNVFKTTNGNDALLRVKLNMNDGTGFIVADGIIAAFNANNSSNVDDEDGQKLTHFGANLALYRSNQFLSIEKRTDPVANDTLHMAVYNASAGAYQLVVEGTNFAASSLVPYLLDNYTNTTTTLSLSSPTTVNFNITTDTLSYGMNRFKIVFQNNVPLASNDIILNAEKTEQGNRINWTVKSESNIAGYEVQRSNDGSGFQVINSVAAKNNNNQNTTYNYLDENPGKSDNFYRIHAKGIDGRELYSSTVRVRSEAKSGTISVTPNPITGQSFNLQLDNMSAADYKMEMFNSVGQLVKMESIHHAGGSSAYVISLPASASKAVYLVKLSSGEKIITQKIQVQ